MRTYWKLVCFTTLDLLQERQSVNLNDTLCQGGYLLKKNSTLLYPFDWYDACIENKHKNVAE